jgi:hypothetical protein
MTDAILEWTRNEQRSNSREVRAHTVADSAFVRQKRAFFQRRARFSTMPNGQSVKIELVHR